MTFYLNQTGHDNEVRALVTCGCGQPNHMMVISHDHSDDETHIVVMLNVEDPWYRRAWLAVRYVLGWKSDFGHYGEIVLERDDLRMLGAMFRVWAKRPEDYRVWAKEGKGPCKS